jgi:lysosomal acid lipase/cholesteryl ester hydrolase
MIGYSLIAAGLMGATLA